MFSGLRSQGTKSNWKWKDCCISFADYPEVVGGICWEEQGRSSSKSFLFDHFADSRIGRPALSTSMQVHDK
jgi:hypothetical protein